MKRQTKGQMLKELVYICLRWLKIGAVWGMVSQSIALGLDRMYDPAPTLGFIGAGFGGELLMCLCKRLFAKKGETDDEP